MMRKYISVILILIFLFINGGYFLWFSVLQYNIQKEISQEIRKGPKKEDLSLIIVSINDQTGISWIKPNKEFIYKGEMYDVVKTKIKNQKKYYYCINDLKEKKLIANYNKNHNSKKKAEKKLTRTFNNIYFPEYFLLINNIHSSDFDYYTFDFLYKSNIVTTPSPPPKTV